LASLLSSSGRFRKSRGKMGKIERTLREADAILDASGYALGSGWGRREALALLLTIRIARRYKKKIVLMPQSFGPFDWGRRDDAHFIDLVRRDLSYPVKIFSREAEGYECLEALGLTNVELSADMVIREKSFPKISDTCSSANGAGVDLPAAGSVGFVLNENLFRIGDSQAVGRLYTQMIDRLVGDGERVYILRTSSRDLNFIEGIHGGLKNRSKVEVIAKEYSSPELMEVMGQFKYIVASRYHSIVFAYRRSVPAVVLGWSAKYSDLAKLFGQEEYLVDIRHPEPCRIMDKIERMRANHAIESSNIEGCLGKVQETSVVREAITALDLD